MTLHNNAPPSGGTQPGGTQPDRSQLRQLLADHFTLDELRTLGQDINVSFDELPGENTTTAKSRELINYVINRGRLDDLLLAAVQARPGVTWPGAAEIERQNPYRGLFAFREEDAANFFGRDEFAARLANAVQKRALVAVVGASGSGKSSVVFAGLLPQLRENGAWLTVHFRPKSDPFLELARALTPLLYSDEVDLLTNTRKLATALAEGDSHLSDIVARILQKKPTASRLLLIADQFEELYTLVPDPDQRQRFLDMLLAAVGSSAGQPLSNSATQPDSTQPSDSPFIPHPSSFTLVLTLRADFLGQALAYRPFADALDRADELLGPMNRAELGQTIAKPAAQQGVLFEAGLVARILDDVGDEPGNLPLLEFALEKLWEQGRSGRLTHVGYEQIGRVQGALATYADDVYNALGVQEKEQARRGYVQLVKPGAGTEDTRRLATRSEIGDETWPLVTQLATARLLVTNQDESGQETVEVVHEALIKRWGRLQEWMAEDRVFREWQERLRAVLRGWEASDNDSGALLRGAPLAEAEGWLAERSGDLNDAERNFIAESISLRVQKALEEEERSQRELKSARDLFEAEQSRSRTFRRFLVGTIILLVIALAIAAYAFISQQEASQQRRIALGQSLAALAPLVVERNNDMELGTLLAIEALRISGSNASRVAWLADDSARSILGEQPFYNNTVTGHEDSVWSVAFSPDGATLASGSADRTIRLWDLSDPSAEPVVLTGHEDWVLSVAFSPDGATLASGSADRTIRLWDLSDPSVEPVVLTGHEDWVWSVAFSPDGATLASGSADRTIRLWDLSDPSAEPVVLTGHEDWVLSVAFSPDGATLASGSADRTIRLWDLSDPSAEPVVLTGHEDWVRSVAFSPDGATLASGSADRTIRLWDLSDPSAEPVVLTGHEDWVRSVAFSPDGATLASGSADRTIRLWDLSDPSAEPVVLTGHEDSVWSVAFSPDGATLASGSADRTIRLWDLSDPSAEPVVLTGHEDSVWSVAFSPDGATLASGSADRTIRLWDLSDPSAEPVVLTGHEDSVWSVAFSPDGATLASGSDDRTIRLWDLSDPSAEPVVLTGHEASVRSVAFSPDGATLASGSADRTIRLWDLSDPSAEPVVLTGHEDWVRSVAFSPDGATLASGSDDRTIRLWDLSDPSAEPVVLTGHEDWVLSVAFSPDGATLASGSADRTIRLWDLSDPSVEPVVLTGHEDWVLSVAFSPDGATLASGSADRTIRLWDLSDPSAEPVVLTGHEDWVRSVAFSPDGATLASGSADRTIRLWVVPQRLIEIGCQKVRRNLSWEEWQFYLGDEPYEQTCPNWPPHPSVP